MLGIYLLATLLMIALLLYSLIKYLEESYIEEREMIRRSRRKMVSSIIRSNRSDAYSSSGLKSSGFCKIERSRYDKMTSFSYPKEKITCFIDVG